MLVDALEAIVQERQYDERDECIGRWRKAIGGDLRRRRNGNGMGEGQVSAHASFWRLNNVTHPPGPSPSNIPSRIPPSPPAKRTISLSDDEFDVPHLNIPFRPPTAIDFKPKLPVPGTASSVNAGPSTAVPQTPTAGPAGFKLKLKMGATSAGKPGLFSPPAMPGGSGPSEVDAPLIQSQLAGMPKRKAEETRPPPRKKSKEQRAEERAYLEESRLRVPDWGLPSGLLPALPPRHAVASGRAALERAAGTSGKEGDGAADAAGTTGSDGLTAAPPADDPASTDEKPTTAPASTDIPLRPPKLDAPALAFLQATLRERLDLQPEVGIVHYRRADRAPAVRPYRALVEGLLGGPAGKGAARAGKRWKVRGLPVGK